jgi:hypothetical protein
MKTLDDYERLTWELEAGQVPAGYPDLLTTVRKLVDEMRVAPWQTAAERTRAQLLVIRLERLTW